MIRDAEINDMPAILKMGRRFFNESGYGDYIEYDIDSTIETIESLINSDTGLLVVSESDGEINGMAGGMVYPFYFNKNHVTGQEFFWWIKPEFRGGKAGIELFKALEERAKNSGAKTFMMVSLDKLNPDLVGRIYEKRGYKKSDHTYIRSL